VDRIDDPFRSQGWGTQVKWTTPGARTPRWFQARGSGARQEAAVVTGKLSSPGAGRTAPHALMQLTGALVENLRKRGFDVLVADPLDGSLHVDRPVRILIGELLAFDAVRPMVTDPGHAIWLGTRPHWSFESQAVARRRAEVAAKRGFWPFVPPWERGEWNRSSDSASAVLAYDGTTYQGRGREVAVVRNSYLRTLAACPLPQRRARGFAWIGTGSLVRKGLDLALEVFATAPELQLYVAGPLHWADQRDFVWHYRRELFHAGNVFPAGYVIPGSAEWRALLETNSFALLPSCAEGTAGALLDSMVCGLIPVATRECGVPVTECGGILIEDTSPGAVRQAAETAAALPDAELRSRAAAARAFALEHYSGTRLAQRVTACMSALIG
jgi:glycosyltransferase involved in cell wall biosynthesis